MWWDNDAYRKEYNSNSNKWGQQAKKNYYLLGLSSLRRFLETSESLDEFTQYVVPTTFRGWSKPFSFSYKPGKIAWIGDKQAVVLDIRGISYCFSYNEDEGWDESPSTWDPDEDYSILTAWLEAEVEPSEDRYSPWLTFDLRWKEEKQLDFGAADVLAVMESIRDWKDYKAEEERKIREEGLIVTKLWG